MIIMEYLPLDVFRSAHLSNIEVWGRLNIVMFELVKHDVSYCQQVAL